jgi:5-(carboxyamino)imidazole ribonucleotide mutase
MNHTVSPEKSVVAVVMGSKSDYEVMKESARILADFNVPYEIRVISAHRTPDLAHEFAVGAEDKGIQVIIAAAGKAAHLAGVLSSLTILPVFGVPMATSDLGGLDSLLSMVQMPAGIPVGTFAIGKAGARNAALQAVAVLALSDTRLREALLDFRKKIRAQTAADDAQIRQAGLQEI